MQLRITCSQPGSSHKYKCSTPAIGRKRGNVQHGLEKYATKMFFWWLFKKTYDYLFKLVIFVVFTVAMPETASFNLNELNSGQFTVDLSGITIPEGGSLNLEDLANNGRLIYIQTDPDANKENDSSQALILVIIQ